MDIVTMAMAKPKIIDMTQFKTTDGYAFNDIILSLVQTSMQNNFSVATLRVCDAEGALRKAMTTDRQLIATITVIDDGVNVTKFPVTVTMDMTRNRASAVSGYAIIYIGIPLEVKYQMVFYNNNDDVTLSGQVTPFA